MNRSITPPSISSKSSATLVQPARSSSYGSNLIIPNPLCRTRGRTIYQEVEQKPIRSASYAPPCSAPCHDFVRGRERGREEEVVKKTTRSASFAPSSSSPFARFHTSDKAEEMEIAKGIARAASLAPTSSSSRNNFHDIHPNQLIVKKTRRSASVAPSSTHDASHHVTVHHHHHYNNENSTSASYHYHEHRHRSPRHRRHSTVDRASQTDPLPQKPFESPAAAENVAHSEPIIQKPFEAPRSVSAAPSPSINPPSQGGAWSPNIQQGHGGAWSPNMNNLNVPFLPNMQQYPHQPHNHMQQPIYYAPPPAGYYTPQPMSGAFQPQFHQVPRSPMLRRTTMTINTLDDDREVLSRLDEHYNKHEKPTNWRVLPRRSDGSPNIERVYERDERDERVPMERVRISPPKRPTYRYNDHEDHYRHPSEPRRRSYGEYQVSRHLPCEYFTNSYSHSSKMVLRMDIDVTIKMLVSAP